VILISNEGKLGGIRKQIQRATILYFMKIFHFQHLLCQNKLSIEIWKSDSGSLIDFNWPLIGQACNWCHRRKNREFNRWNLRLIPREKKPRVWLDLLIQENFVILLFRAVNLLICHLVDVIFSVLSIRTLLREFFFSFPKILEFSRIYRRVVSYCACRFCFSPYHVASTLLEVNKLSTFIQTVPNNSTNVPIPHQQLLSDGKRSKELM
jgi:hypothetical protein